MSWFVDVYCVFRWQGCRFRVATFIPQQYGDNVTRDIVDGSHDIVTPERDLAAIRAAVASRAIDVLVISDHGYDPFMYTLLQSRIAPVQVGRVHCCCPWH